MAVPQARDKLLRVLHECVGAACFSAGLPNDSRFRSACVGLSGGAADKREVVADAIRSENLLVTDDAVIALSGALAGEPGIIAIAGTGSIAFGRNAERETVRAGGWGYIFGDEGSAFDVVRQSLRAALRQAEGWGSATLLSEMLLQETGAADMNSVLHLFYTPDWPRSRVAELAVLVDRDAENGDPLAQQILRNAGQQLGSLTFAIKRQLWPDEQTIAAVYVGGLFNSGFVLESYIESCERNGCDVRVPLMPPAAGALLEAYRLAGLSPDPRKLVTSRF